MDNRTVFRFIIFVVVFSNGSAMAQDLPYKKEQPHKSDASRKVFSFKSQRKREHRSMIPLPGIYCSLIAETGQSMLHTPHTPMILTMNSYHLTSRLFVPVTGPIPSYTFGIELGDSQDVFMGMTFVLFDTRFPGTKFGEAFSMELFYGKNIRLSDRFTFRPTFIMAPTITNGQFFNTDVKNPVDIRFREIAWYYKARIDVAYRVNSSIKLVAGGGLCLTFPSKQFFDINDGQNKSSLKPNMSDINFYGASPGQVFNYNGLFFTVGIHITLKVGY